MFCIQVVLIDELVLLLDELDLGSFLGHDDVSPANLWFTHHEEVVRSASSVRAVGSRDPLPAKPGAGRGRGCGVVIGFVEADDRPSFVGRFEVA